MSTTATKLAQECRRLEENCLYTSTSLFIWLRWLRAGRLTFTTLPVVLGSLASWAVLQERAELWTAILAFLAGLLPALYEVLKPDAHIGELKVKAAEFKNLQDRFRQCAEVWSLKAFGEFEAEFRDAREKLEEVRTASITPPDWMFRLARRKIEAGHYSFDVDKEAVNNAPP